MKMKSRLFGLGAVTALACTLASPGYAATPTTTPATPATAIQPAISRAIHGTVTDSLGRPLADATISLLAADGHSLGTARSDAAGHFAFTGIVPGTYELTADKNTFQQGMTIVTLTAQGDGTPTLILASNTALSIKVKAHRLDIARNTISVETGSSTYRMTHKAIENLPQGNDTPLNQVLLQAPGVVQDSFGQLHVRGDHGDLQYRINGTILPESVSGFGQVLDPSFAQNINLLTGALPAQYGYRTAGIVDIQTQSGAFEQGGDIGVTVGSNATRDVNARVSGSKGNFNYYITGSELQNNLGIENPTSSTTATHDHTLQNNGFGYFSDLLDANTRISLIMGHSDNRFQIPDNPGQTPTFAYTDPSSGITYGPSDTAYPSSQLNENQKETTEYGILALQGTVGDGFDYQVSAFSRYTNVTYTPDVIGDMVYNGVAATTQQAGQASGLQADFSYKLNDSHTLRSGLFYSQEDVTSDNSVLTFNSPNQFQPASQGSGTTSFTDNTQFTSYLSGVYLQDEWKATQKLTVNYGARYDQVRSTVDGCQLSPRLGAVYKITPQTTLHAGYARYYTPPPTELIASETVSKFEYTTNAPNSAQNGPVLPETDDYFDLGVNHEVTQAFTVGLDSYYKNVKNLLDEGQFGSALIYTPFNYKYGKVYGIELSANYHGDKLSAYANIARSTAMGKDIISSQYQIDPGDLTYIQNHWIHLDHDQAITASAGISYPWHQVTYGLDAIYGSGLRKDSTIPNGGEMPAYTQLNFSAKRNFQLGALGKFSGRFTVINLLDNSYELRDGTGVGVGAPQYGPRRGFYLSLDKKF